MKSYIFSGVNKYNAGYNFASRNSDETRKLSIKYKFKSFWCPLYRDTSPFFLTLIIIFLFLAISCLIYPIFPGKENCCLIQDVSDKKAGYGKFVDENKNKCNRKLHALVSIIHRCQSLSLSPHLSPSISPPPFISPSLSLSPSLPLHLSSSSPSPLSPSLPPSLHLHLSPLPLPPPPLSASPSLSPFLSLPLRFCSTSCIVHFTYLPLTRFFFFFLWTVSLNSG